MKFMVFYVIAFMFGDATGSVLGCPISPPCR
jgi:hypothetical protein